MTAPSFHAVPDVTSALATRPVAAASEDLRYGQVVIVTARWVLIASGLIIALWSPGPVEQLRIQIATTLVLATINFYLHAQLLVKRPVLDAVVYAASIGDLAVITAIIASQGGYASGNYIFYFPAVLAFAVSFPRPITALFAGSAAIAYGLIATATVPAWTASEQTAVFLRVLTLVAVAACGSLYWAVERDRRARAQSTGGIS
jgi:hypothetical protein